MTSESSINISDEKKAHRAYLAVLAVLAVSSIVLAQSNSTDNFEAMRQVAIKKVVENITWMLYTALFFIGIILYPLGFIVVPAIQYFVFKKDSKQIVKGVLIWMFGFPLVGIALVICIWVLGKILGG